MNKSELIEAVASTAGLDRKQADAAVGAFVDSVVARTRGGESVSIFGFGTFKPTARAARTGRNPQTGAPVKIAASKSVKFQPATAFKSALNSKKAAAKKTAAKKATATKATPARASAKAATKAAATRAAASKAAKAASKSSTKSTAKAAKAPAKSTRSAKKR